MKIILFLSNKIFYTAVFVFLFVFFSRIHPIVPYDTDDWINMIIERPSYPSIDYWNPTKVFPERFEPFVTTIASYLIAPIAGDYINSLILANAIIVTFFILMYLLSVQRYIEYRFTLNRLTSQMLMIIFIILHFLVLRSSEECNEHLWYSNDSNCYYHYIIPNMLCASLVLWLMRHDVRKEKNGRTIALLIMLTYLALCSNLYSVVILIAYLGATLVIELKNTNLKSYIRRNAPYIIVIFFWLIIQWIESSGKRANCYGFLHKPLIHCLAVTTYNFLSIHYNLWFIFISLLTLIYVKLHEYKKNKQNLYFIRHQEGIILLSLFLSIIYLILLSSRVNPNYIQRGDVIFEFAFFFLLLVILSMAYLCKHVQHSIVIAPFLIIFLIFQTNTSNRTFKDVCEKYPPDLQKCISFDRDIVRRILDAEAQGLDSVVINVPKYPDSENWPITTINNHLVCNGIVLYKHNLMKRPITTIFIPSYEIE